MFLQLHHALKGISSFLILANADQNFARDTAQIVHLGQNREWSAPG